MDITTCRQLGYLSANIAGDHRYTDTLRVYLDTTNDTVVLEVFSSGSVGGMDGPGGATEPTPQLKEVSKPGAKGPEVMKMIKRVTSDTRWNFKNYGKPTKRFKWTFNGYGFSAALCTSELTLAREDK